MSSVSVCLGGGRSRTAVSRKPWLADLRVLRDTILESLRESPGAFLASSEQTAKEDAEFWQRKLASAAWAVVQDDTRTLGIAAAKPPTETDGYALAGRACFIESVWVHPDVRKQGVGGRLVNYLIEQQRQIGIQDFYLWVFDDNKPALRFYEDKRMGFKRTGRPSDLRETQFWLQFDSDVIDEDEQRRNWKARAKDERLHRITYRMLVSPR